MGDLHLENPTLLASGVHGSSLQKVLDALKFGAGAAVTKSIGPTQREGFEEPTLVEVEGGWVNSAGLPNPGATSFSGELEKIKGKGLPIFVSIFGRDGDEFGTVARKLEGNDFLGYELNLSCPHVEGVGTEVGHDPKLVREVVSATRSVTSNPIFAKLSPNTDRLLEVAQAAIDGGADGLTAINTLRAFPIDVETGGRALSNGFGGLSGGAIRTVGLRCVYELRSKLHVPIMGCGGISTWEHAVQYFLAGADAVQIGSGTIKRFDLFNDICIGILSYLERKGVKSVGDVVGKAQAEGKVTG